MAAPAFGTAGTQLQGTASTMNVDVPDSVAVGDIIVVTAFIDTAGATVTGLATDFAHATDSPEVGDNHSLVVMWKRATGADATGGTYDFTLSGSVYRNAQAIRYTGAVESGNPWDVTDANNSGASGSSVTPAVSDTTTVDDTLLVWAATNWAGGTWTPPTSFTERRDSGDGTCTVADLAQAAAGATGSITGTSSSTDKECAWLGALKPSTAVFPVVETTNESATASVSTTHIVNLPTGIAAGDLLLVLSNIGTTAATFNTLSGWTELVDEGVAGGIAIWYREADGTEGSTVTFTSSATTRDASISYRISGAEDPATQAPQLSTVATAASASPNATTCTPTGGAKDYLWITMFGQAGEQADDDTLTTVTPTGFSNPIEKTCGTVGTNLGGMIASAQQQLNAASLDASAWTSSDTGTWRAYTIAVHPAGTGTDAPAGIASATGAASQPSVRISPTAGIATGAGAALGPAVRVGPAPEAPAGTATAPQPTISVRANAGLAAATASAPQPTVDTGTAATNAPAGLAAATGTANPPTVSIAPAPVAPVAVGAALAPTAALGVRPGAPEGVGSAPQPTVQTGAFTNAPAGLASGTGTANQPSISIRPTAGVSAASGSAAAPVALISTRAGVGSAAGSALAPTVMTGAVALAGLAGAAGSAPAPRIAIRVLAGLSAAVGSAPAAVGQGELPVERLTDPLTLDAVDTHLYLSAATGVPLTLDATESPLTLEAMED